MGHYEQRSLKESQLSQPDLQNSCLLQTGSQNIRRRSLQMLKKHGRQLVKKKRLEKLEPQRQKYIEDYTVFVRGLDKEELEMYTELKQKRDEEEEARRQNESSDSDSDDTSDESDDDSDSDSESDSDM